MNKHYLIPTVCRSFVLLISVFIVGCVSLGNVADSLSDAISNQQDLATVRDGAPAYLLLVDSLIANDPENEALLLASSRLYGAYATAFVTEPKRAGIMSSTALKYAQTAMCLQLKDLCAALDQPMDIYQQALSRVQDQGDIRHLYTFISAWAGWVQANTSNWQAIADLPKVQAGMQQVLRLDENYDNGNPHLYLGVLLTLRPAALGGQPELGRKHFEKAMSLSENRHLMAKVLFARHYARLVFDRDLHDRLLNEVISANPETPGLTLSNVLAQQQAELLLQSSEEYF